MKLLPIIALMLCGCVQTTLQTPDGFKFTTMRPVWSGSISEMEVQTGDAIVKVRGYKSDANRTIESVAAGVARGLGKP